MGIFEKGSLIYNLSEGKGAITIAIVFLIIACIYLIGKIVNLSLVAVVHNIIKWLLDISSKFIKKKEIKYHRELEIGKINDKMRKVKIYRFLNDLIIDLGLKQMGATPYEFLFICLVVSGVISIIVCQILFRSIFMAVLMYPIIFAGLMSILYTKANIAHDTRIEHVIEAENIICNNIKDGVMVAVKNNLDVIPVDIRGVFRDFIDNVEHKNYHIKTALMELNHQLGNVADDFIKKCIIFETEEQHGIVGMFKDVVEINNIKMELRINMKRRLEDVVREFIIGATTIFVFLGGVIGIYPHVKNFYFNTIIGQIIIAIDILIAVGEFVFIYLRAKEL